MHGGLQNVRSPVMDPLNLHTSRQICVLADTRFDSQSNLRADFSFLSRTGSVWKKLTPHKMSDVSVHTIAQGGFDKRDLSQDLVYRLIG